MKNWDIIAYIITAITIIAAFVFCLASINPDKHYSDPAVYERYVEDMRSVGRKPNGEPLDLGGMP